ncbi:MAG TPA: Holliday junction resolvase RuvX [Actinomycetota bacterium]|nr:Holliday junction resolvase RuvX [Actinomycetota bacterium]
MPGRGGRRGPGARRTPGPALGLDLGEARIGVAISDDARRVAVPLGTIRAGAPDDLRAVAKLVAERGVTVVVVGHPLSMSGVAGEAARRAERFAEGLRAVLEVPVVLGDERLSTAEAERELRRAGADARARRRARDASAAAVILQAYLDATRGG